MSKVSKIAEELYREGREEGEHLKTIQVAEKVFRTGTSLSDVMDITGLSEQEADEIWRNLN